MSQNLLKENEYLKNKLRQKDAKLKALYTMLESYFEHGDSIRKQFLFTDKTQHPFLGKKRE